MKEIRKIVIAPDSFKGTMEASQVCQIIQGSARQYFPDAAVRCIPMADGGEGMVDAYLKLLGGAQGAAFGAGASRAPGCLLLRYSS